MRDKSLSLWTVTVTVWAARAGSQGTCQEELTGFIVLKILIFGEINVFVDIFNNSSTFFFWVS
jgi:hypothetical protein